MHNQPPSPPYQGGNQGTWETSRSYGTRGVPTTINVHLLLEVAIIRRNYAHLSDSIPLNYRLNRNAGLLIKAHKRSCAPSVFDSALER